STSSTSPTAAPSCHAYRQHDQPATDSRAPQSGFFSTLLEVVLVEEAALGDLGLDGRVGERRRADVDLQLVATLLHRLHGAVEHDLERGELLVDVVLDLEAQDPGAVLGLGDDPVGGAA